MAKTFAITRRIEEIRAQLPHASAPKRRIDLLTELALWLSDREQVEAARLVKQAKQACKEHPFSKQPYDVGIAHANITLASLAFRQADYETAIRLAHDSQMKLEAAGVTVGMASTYKIIAICYSELGNSVESSRYSYAGIEIAKANNYRIALAGLYLNLSLNEGNLALLEHALVLGKQIGDEETEALAAANLADMLLDQNKTEGVAQLLEDSISIAEQIGWQQVMAYGLTTKGRLFQLQGDLDSAETYYMQGLQVGRTCDDPLLMGLILQAYASFEMVRDNCDVAVQYIEEGIELAEKSQQMPTLARYYKLLTSVYEQSDDLAQALASHKKYAELTEAIESTKRDAQQRLVQISQQAEAARREAQFEREKNVELETRVGERTAALQASLEREHRLTLELETALQAEAELSALKSKIITTVSHEFRTPLTVINNSVELLERYHDKISAEQRNKNFTRVRYSISQLVDMLNDVGLLNDAGPRAIEPMHSVLPFDEAAEQLQRHQNCQLLNSPRVRYWYDSLDQQPIVTDIAMLGRIVGGLLANSVKFSAENSPIVVNLSAEAGHLILSVQDLGIGILAADQPKVFDLFYRGQNTGHRRGVGLGLNVIRKLVHALDGAIELESAGQDMGTTFTVKVPCRVTESSDFLVMA